MTNPTAERQRTDKKCAVCKIHKLLEDFAICRKAPDGRAYTCRACAKAYRQRNKDKLSTYYRQWSQENAAHVSAAGRVRALRRRFRMTEDQYEAMLLAQGNRCAICGRTPEANCRRLAVDHDHACCPDRRQTCGECIRGLLCTACNHRLGVVENLEWMASARAYLAKVGSKNTPKK